MADEHRPPNEFWGPVRRQEGDEYLDFDLIPDENQARPKKCLICSNQTLLFVANVYGWPIFECVRCGLGFVWPQPSSEFLAQFYGPSYWSNYLGSTEPLYSRPDMVGTWKRSSECLDRILGGNRKARVLDVGAGDGTILRFLADRGYQNLLGLDLDKDNARRATEKMGVPVVSHDFLEFKESEWNAIVLWAVIEHLKAPLDFLRHARSLLAPGGICIVMTGDNSSAHAWVEGTMDYWVYPPEHLFFFTASSIRWMFREAGFERFRSRLQLQPLWKESLLWLHRFCRAVGVRIRSRNPFYRSIYSNLLVAWGQKP
jgi:SAM-dependent methyltransferase